MGRGSPDWAPVRRIKAELTSCASGFFENPCDLTARQNATLMQDDEVVARNDFVEQMSGPQHANALFGDELADMAKHIGARLDVEPDGRLIKQKQPRPVQQRAGDLQPAHLPAGKIAHLAAGAVGKSDARQDLVTPRSGIAPADTMQGGVIEQILHHREIEIERAGLKYHAHEPQRFAWAPGRYRGRKSGCFRPGFRTAASQARTACFFRRR